MTPDQMQAAITAGVRAGMANQSSNANQGTASSGANLETIKKNLGQVAEAALPVYFGFNRLASGTDAASAAITGITNAAKALPFGGLIGKLGDLGEGILNQKKIMDQAGSQLGIGGNNLGLFVRMAGEAGITTQQFSDTVRKSDGVMAGVGANAQKSAEQFSKVTKSVQESDLGVQLQLAGVSAQEMAEYTSLAMANDIKGKRDSATYTRDAALAAQGLAQELDLSSKLTGQSREALAKTIQEEEKKPNVTLAMINMEQSQREGYKKTLEQMAKMGPGFESLTTEIVTGGIRTKEGSLKMAALGTAGEQYQQAVMAMKNAKTADEKIKAERDLQEAQVAINKRMASTEFNDIMQNGSDEMKRTVGGMVEGNKTLLPSVQAAAEHGGDMAAGMKAAKDAIVNQQLGLTEDGKGKDTGQETARALNEANHRAMIQAGGLAQNFEKVNSSIGEFISKGGLQGAMKYVGSADKMDDAAAKQRADAKTAGDAISKALSLGDTSKAEKPKGGTDNQGRVSVPAHAEGGIIQGPELAVIAEKGPEAVVPLDKMKEMMGAGGGINLAEIGKTISTTISSVTKPGGEPTDNEKLKAKAEEALKIIKEHGEGSFETNIRITKSGNLRLSEQFDQHNERFQSLGQESAEQRIAELIAQAEKLKAVDAEKSNERVATIKDSAKTELATTKDVKDMSVDELIKRDMENIQNQTAKVKDVKDMSTEELIKRDMANIQNSTQLAAKAKETLTPKPKEPGVSDLKEQYAKMSTDLSATPEGLKSLKDKITAAEAKANAPKPGDIGFVTEQKKQMESMFASIGGGAGGPLGDMFNPVIKNAKAAEANKAKFAAEEAKNKEKPVPKPDIKKDDATKTAETSKPTDTKPKTDANLAKGDTGVTLKDLNDQLIKLNSNIMQLVSHSETTANSSVKTAKNSAKATGTRW